MSQRALAHKLGIKQPNISYDIDGTSTPDPAGVFALEEQLGCAPGELSQTLGYVPVACIRNPPPCTTPAAIEADPILDGMFKAGMLAAYREFVDPKRRR